MNDTLRILSSLAWEIQKAQGADQPQWTQLEEKCARVQKEFWSKHRGNRTLLDQVDDLLTTQCLLSEYHAEFQFLLGLQMGLELAHLDLLQATREQNLIIHPNL